MKGKMTLFIIGFIVWALLTWPCDAQDMMAGVFVVAFVVFVTIDLFCMPMPHSISRKPGIFGFLNLSRYVWFCCYVPLFLWECLKANIDVALRVLSPDLPINPGIVKVKTTLKSHAALTFLANSITLTPGTFCVDIKPEEAVMYIHWIYVRSKDTEKATQLIVSKFENILKRIFE